MESHQDTKGWKTPSTLPSIGPHSLNRLEWRRQGRHDDGVDRLSEIDGLVGLLADIADLEDVENHNVENDIDDVHELHNLELGAHLGVVVDHGTKMKTVDWSLKSLDRKM